MSELFIVVKFVSIILASKFIWKIFCWQFTCPIFPYQVISIVVHYVTGNWAVFSVDATLGNFWSWKNEVMVQPPNLKLEGEGQLFLPPINKNLLIFFVDFLLTYYTQCLFFI